MRHGYTTDTLYPELYDNATMLDAIEILLQKYQCDEKFSNESSCAECPYYFKLDNDYNCLPSVLGEVWRRLMNKKHEKQND